MVAPTPEAGPDRVRIETRKTADAQEWEELLAHDRRATLFHRPRWNLRYAWYHPRAAARWLEARDGRGVLVGGLPYVETRRLGARALVSGVGGTYAGPVVRGEDLRVQGELLRAFLRVGGWRTVRRELVWGGDTAPAEGLPGLRPIEAAVLPTEVPFELFWQERFPKNRRNECNRSERRGLSVECTRDIEPLRAFLPTYRSQAERWGVRAESGIYLEALLEEEPNSLFFVTRLADEVVGGHVCFHLEDELFAWTGTTRRLDGFFPSSLLIKAEIQYACDHGLRRLNLGSSLGLQGVANYKRLLGAESALRWLMLWEAAPLRWGRRWRRSSLADSPA